MKGPAIQHCITVISSNARLFTLNLDYILIALLGPSNAGFEFAVRRGYWEE